MKKLTCVLTVIALAGVMLCFAACGTEKTKEDMTTMENEITSMIDDATSMGEELAEDLTQEGNVTDQTEENLLEKLEDDMTEDTTDIIDDAEKSDTTAERE